MTAAADDANGSTTIPMHTPHTPYPLSRVNQILQKLIQLDNRKLLPPLGPERLLPITAVDLLTPANQFNSPPALERVPLV